MTNYKQLIQNQSSIAQKQLACYLSKGQDFALVDFPDHNNVGDSAIWLGEIALFRKMVGADPGYVSTVESYSPQALREACPQGPIFIHGGGNFGDIYPKHQEFRIRLMADFPDRSIIQLPQSISFRQQDLAQRTARSIAKHGRSTLLARDRASLDFVNKNFDCPVVLLPDMAFCMGPLARPDRASSPIFMLLREDTERSDYDRQPLLARADAVAADWLDEPKHFARLMRWKTRLRMLGRGVLHSPAGRLVYYQLLAQGRLARGLRLLSSGRCVVTDRLHAHILSTMLDIPHVVLDNNYGKINGYMDAWTGGYQRVRRARTADDVLHHLQAWADEARDVG